MPGSLAEAVLSFVFSLQSRDLVSDQMLEPVGEHDVSVVCVLPVFKNRDVQTLRKL